MVVVVVDDDGICHTFDASEIRRENHPTCMKPVVHEGIFHISTWCDFRISEPSTRTG